MNQSMNELVTRLFIEQPLASPGSAEYIVSQKNTNMFKMVYRALQYRLFLQNISKYIYRYVCIKIDLIIFHMFKLILNLFSNYKSKEQNKCLLNELKIN